MKIKKIFLFFIIGISIVLGAVIIFKKTNLEDKRASSQKTPAIIANEEVIITEALDAITFKTNDDRLLRMIGVYTPKKDECFNKEAYEAAKSLMGKKIHITLEPLINTSNDGALLRYFWLDTGKKDEKGEKKEDLLNENILERGMAFPFVNLDMKWGDRLLAAAKYSRGTGRGLWSACEITQNQQGFFLTQFKK